MSLLESPATTTMFLERYTSNFERLGSRFENGHTGTRSTAQSSIGSSKSPKGEPQRTRVLRGKSIANLSFFIIEILAHACNEYALIKSARILLTSLFVSLWFF